MAVDSYPRRKSPAKKSFRITKSSFSSGKSTMSSIPSSSMSCSSVTTAASSNIAKSQKQEKSSQAQLEKRLARYRLKIIDAFSQIQVAEDDFILNSTKAAQNALVQAVLAFQDELKDQFRKVKKYSDHFKAEKTHIDLLMKHKKCIEKYEALVQPIQKRVKKDVKKLFF